MLVHAVDRSDSSLVALTRQLSRPTVSGSVKVLNRILQPGDMEPAFGITGKRVGQRPSCDVAKQIGVLVLNPVQYHVVVVRVQSVASGNQDRRT